MVVMCKVADCPFLSGTGFCRQHVLQIRENGGCGYVYKRVRQVNPYYREPVDEKYKANEYQE